MRNLFVVLAVSLAGILVATQAYAADEFRWEHFGGDPVAESRVDAMSLREEAFGKLGLPEEVKVHFIKATLSPGETIYLVPGDRLDGMLSGGVLTPEVKVHHNVIVVDTPAGKRGLSNAIRAEQWVFDWQGKRYELILPEVCFNWSIRIIPIPQEKESCGAIYFNAKAGDVIRPAYLSDEDRLPRSTCWGLVDGNIISDAPSPCDDCVWNAFPVPEQVVEKNLYTSREGGQQILIVPLERVRHFNAICITRADIQSCSVIIEPTDWKKEQVTIDGSNIVAAVTVPDSLFVWDKQCPGENFNQYRSRLQGMSTYSR